jgi:hypothetical protein
VHLCLTSMSEHRREREIVLFYHLHQFVLLISENEYICIVSGLMVLGTRLGWENFRGGDA